MQFTTVVFLLLLLVTVYGDPDAEETHGHYKCLDALLGSGALTKECLVYRSCMSSGEPKTSQTCIDDQLAVYLLEYRYRAERHVEGPTIRWIMKRTEIIDCIDSVLNIDGLSKPVPKSNRPCTSVPSFCSTDECMRQREMELLQGYRHRMPLVTKDPVADPRVPFDGRCVHAICAGMENALPFICPTYDNCMKQHPGSTYRCMIDQFRDIVQILVRQSHINERRGFGILPGDGILVEPPKTDSATVIFLVCGSVLIAVMFLLYVCGEYNHPVVVNSKRAD